VISVRRNISNPASWDDFAIQCGCSYRCSFHAARLNDSWFGWRVRRLEIFFHWGFVQSKVGQCTILAGRSLTIIGDQLQLLPSAQPFWRESMDAVLAALGPGRYIYGSEWCTERPRGDDIAGLKSVTVMSIRRAYLEAIEFDRWTCWGDYWKSISSNARRNFKKAEGAPGLRIERFVGLKMLAALPSMISLRRLALNRKLESGYKISRSLKTLLRTLMLRNKIEVVACVIDQEKVSFSSCVQFGSSLFYLEGGSKPGVKGAGWYVLLSTIRRAFERTAGAGLFVMGPVDQATLENPDWHGLARSRQQCRVTQRPIETIIFDYAPLRQPSLTLRVRKSDEVAA
jgi:hypothetical protein